MTRLIAAAFALALGLSPALASNHAPLGRGEGEVRKIDVENGKITLKHGPLEGLDMPGMTMVFRTQDPALLGKVRVGDAVRFTAAQEGGAFVLKSIEPKQ